MACDACRTELEAAEKRLQDEIGRCRMDLRTALDRAEAAEKELEQLREQERVDDDEIARLTRELEAARRIAQEWIGEHKKRVDENAALRAVVEAAKARIHSDICSPRGCVSECIALARVEKEGK